MIYHQFDNSKKNFHYNAYIYRSQIMWNSHFHDSYELIYVYNGELEVSFNGERTTLEPHELLLLSPNAVHSFEVKEGMDVWVGVFSADHVDAFAHKYSAVQFGKFRCESECERMLEEKLFIGEKPDRYLRISYLYAICDACVKNAERLNTHTERKFMNDVIEYISQRLDDDISLRELASTLGYEYHYLSSLFNRCFSMNFKRFLNLYKVAQACALLRKPERNVMEVYRECGFSSMRNFNRVFKEITGLTPSEYKRTS